MGGTAWRSGPQQKWDMKDHHLALLWIPALFPDLPKCEAPLPLTTATVTSSPPSRNGRLKSGAQRNLFHEAASACHFVTAMRKVRDKTGHLAAHCQHRSPRSGTATTWSSWTQREAVSDTSSTKDTGDLQHRSRKWHMSQDEKPGSGMERGRHCTQTRSAKDF